MGHSRGLRDLVATRWGRPAARAMRTLNARHPWSHNDHFHSWVLHELPEHRRAALDVGCGQGGLLVELAPWFERVEGVDADAAMREQARERVARLGGVEVSDARLEDLRGPYDLVTMIAVLHHLDLEAALEQVRDLLGPGGRFLSVGLASPVTRTDRLWDAASMVTNPLIGRVKHPWPARTGPGAPVFPVADPSIGVDELVARAQRIMPGLRARRHLAFRHTLEWTKPGRPHLS